MGRVMIGANCGQMTPCGPRVSMRTSSLHSLGGQEWGGYWVHLLLEKAWRTAGAQCYQYPNHQTSQLWGSFSLACSWSRRPPDSTLCGFQRSQRGCKHMETGTQSGRMMLQLQRAENPTQNGVEENFPQQEHLRTARRLINFLIL